MTPLISAETGEGAAGCASGSHTCNGTRPALAPNPISARQNATAAPVGAQMRGTHGVEGEMPAAALKDAETQQDGDRAEMRHHQIEKAGLADLRQSMLGGDQKIRGQRHGLPREHEGVRVIGDQDIAHAGEKQVVLQTNEPGRRALAPPEIPCRKNRNAARRGAEQHQEYAREPISTQVGRQIRQADGQNQLFGGMTERRGGHQRQCGADQRPQGEQSPRDECNAPRAQQSGDAHHAPCRQKQRTKTQRRMEIAVHETPDPHVGNETIYGSGQIIIILCALKCHLM